MSRGSEKFTGILLMVQLNPVPVFGAKKKPVAVYGNFSPKFRTNGHAPSLGWRRIIHELRLGISAFNFRWFQQPIRFCGIVLTANQRCGQNLAAVSTSLWDFGSGPILAGATKRKCLRLLKLGLSQVSLAPLCFVLRLFTFPPLLSWSSPIALSLGLAYRVTYLSSIVRTY